MEFAERMESLIDNGLYDEFVEELFEPANIDRVKANGMELVTQVCSKGINEVEETNPNLTIWLDALDYIVEHANPKEAYAGLLEQAVVFTHTNKFVYLLRPIQVVFSKIPTVRASHMESILKYIEFHIKSHLSVPDYIKAADWEEKETLAIEEDPEMRRILQCYNYSLKLISTFVHDFVAVQKSPIASEPKVVEDLGRRESLLRNTLVNLLGKPLTYFDLHWEEDPKVCALKAKRFVKTEGRVVAEKIMTLLSDMNADVPYILDWLNEKSNYSNKANKLGSQTPTVPEGGDSEMDPISEDKDYSCSAYEPKLDMVSIVSYFYMLMDQNIGAEHICTVYTPAYVFNTTLVAIVECLENDKNMIVKKATALTNTLLVRCNPPNNVTICGLKAYMIQTDEHKNFIEKIVEVILYCKIKSVRCDALESLKKYLWAFDGYGRFMLLVRGFDMIQHSGLVGYLITQLKDFIREALYDPQASQQMKEYFLGERLRTLLLSVCSLKDGATTDLMENSDKIVSLLNLVRYLVLTDSAANRSGFYSSMEDIDKVLLSPLRIALDYSKAHFQQELRRLNEDPNSPSTFSTQSADRDQVESTVLVDGKEVSASEVPVSEKIQSVSSALSVFDMMFSLLARVNECYSQSKVSVTSKSET